RTLQAAVDTLAHDRLRAAQIRGDIRIGAFVEHPGAYSSLLALGQFGEQRLHVRLAAQRGELLDAREIVVVEQNAPVAELPSRPRLDPPAPVAAAQLVLGDRE